MKDDKINNQKIYCSVCGAPNDADAGYCEACGAKIEQVPMYGEMTRKKSSKKGLAVAIILAVFVLAAGVILIFFFLSKKNETEAVHVGREKKIMSVPVHEDKPEEDKKTSEDVSEVLKEDADEGLGESEENAAKGDKTSDVQEEISEEDDVYMEKENEKSPDPSKEILEGQPNPVNDVVDVEAEVEYIRTIYYGVTMHLDDFRTYESADHITVYEAKSDQHIQCIVADIGAYSQDNFTLSDKYAAEYYYDYDSDSGKYTQRFIFVHNKDYSEEYRIYLTADQKCLRYIGPYESAETTYDYEYPIADLESITPVYQFHTYGWRELHLMGIY